MNPFIHPFVRSFMHPYINGDADMCLLTTKSLRCSYPRLVLSSSSSGSILANLTLGLPLSSSCAVIMILLLLLLLSILLLVIEVVRVMGFCWVRNRDVSSTPRGKNNSSMHFASSLADGRGESPFGEDAACEFVGHILLFPFLPLGHFHEEKLKEYF